jgi:hypothetical protein
VNKVEPNLPVSNAT